MNLTECPWTISALVVCGFYLPVLNYFMAPVSVLVVNIEVCPGTIIEKHNFKVYILKKVTMGQILPAL